MSNLDLDDPVPASDTASIEAPSCDEPGRIDGVRVGILLGVTNAGQTPLVLCPRQSAALPARTTVDLHGAHIGCGVVIMFEDGDARRPIVVGRILDHRGSLAEAPGHVDIEADGERLLVSAKEQLVLRCGKASITLTKAGKVLIEGEYLSSRSTGVNRIKGGSVQLN